MKKTIATLVMGEVLLVAIRKILKDASKPELGYKASIEVADYVNGRQVSVAALMNSEDDRFTKIKPQRAFQPVDLNVAIAEGWITEEEFNKLESAKDIDVKDQVEGKHYKTLNILNPTFQGHNLKIQVIETTSTTRKNAELLKKINPSTGKVVTSGGKPVYRIVQIAFEGTYENVFLPSDKVSTIQPEVKKVTTSMNLNA